jgi:hypothetical protein
MKIYIYTIPKAGTYFLADFVSRLGFNNTGWHASRGNVLNTIGFDAETNSRYPSRTVEKQPFMRTLNLMNDGDLAFGHFAVPLMGWLFPGFFYICAYRHPRETLVSEFVDFRFRRKDVGWLSQERVPDDKEAFSLFLAKHGPNHMGVFSQMLAVTLLQRERLCHAFEPERFHILNFNSLLNDPGAARALAAALGKSSEEAAAALEATKQAETKTKATDLAIDREALWSDAAEEFYHDLDAEAFVERGRQLGWAL